jgi:putative FmdB family regulatory protein
MPTYNYICEKCNNVQEEYHMMSENPKIKCVKCGSTKISKEITNCTIVTDDTRIVKKVNYGKRK